MFIFYLYSCKNILNMEKLQKIRLVRVSDYLKEFAPNVTRQTLYNWIKEKKLKSKEIGGYKFIIVPIE